MKSVLRRDSEAVIIRLAANRVYLELADTTAACRPYQEGLSRDCIELISLRWLKCPMAAETTGLGGRTTAAVSKARDGSILWTLRR
jgi:hypothetical protein